MMPVYSKNDLKNFLVRFMEEHGRTPTTKDFDSSSKYPSAATYYHRFGSWNKALIESGLKINQKRGTYTKNELLQILVDFEKEYSRCPTQKDFISNSKFPDPSTYSNNFDSWSNALELARIDTKEHGNKYTERELLDFIIDFYNINGKNPTTKDFNRLPGYPDSSTYRQRFGSWPNAIKKAGLTPKRETPRKYKTEEERKIGLKKVNLKSVHKRKRSMGFVPLNKYFENSHAHHLHIRNHNDVLYIPRELHMAIGHDHHSKQNMFEINLHSLNWYLHNYDDLEEFKVVMNAFNLNIDDTDTNSIINSFKPGVNDELRQKLILLNTKLPEYSDYQLISRIQLYYKKHGKIPEFSDFQDHEIDPLLYLYKYNSWVSALRSMGYDVTELLDKNKRYTKAELIQYLKALANDLGRVPLIIDIDNKPNYPTSAPYRSMFGSWNNALIECGFDVNYQTYTKLELISCMKAFYEENGRPPMIKDFENNSLYPGRNAYTRVFGSWNNALLKCGFKIVHSSFTKEELIDYIHKYHEEYGTVPKYDDFRNNPNYPAAKSYERQFGSWSSGIKEAGYEPFEHKEKFTDDQMIECMRDFYTKYGRIPSYSDFSKNPEYPSARTYSVRFGSWKKALEIYQNSKTT
jgi:sulfur relay (sulfurtransferase) DsrC/TusE family protein